MCEKTNLGEPSREFDSCLIDEINELKTEYFNRKFGTIMSCCGHGKYSKTLIVRNKISGAIFEWFSGIRLYGTKRAKNKAPYYKKDSEGYYFIPEVDEEK